MGYTRRTGGVKKFYYTKEDMRRIENEDTDSTKSFKASYTEWIANKGLGFFKSRPSSHNPKKDPFGGINNFFNRINRRTYQEFRDWNGFILTTLALVLLTIAIMYVYKNIEQLNEITFLIFRLGSTLLVSVLLLWIHFAWKLIRILNQWFKRARHWQKYFIVLALIFILFLAYKGTIDIVSPIKNRYESFDKSYLNPFSFGDGTDKTFTDVVGEENLQKVKEVSSNIADTFKIEPEQKEECMEAFDYVNQLRKQHGKKTIMWDDNAYRLAVDRSKDMYENNYFDHTSPAGKCPANMKQDYNLGKYTLAENIGAQYSGYSDFSMSFDYAIEPKEQVDGWMDSRGHRYNLLYDTHVIGAIGCYHGVCVFLGGHTSQWGLGAGGCSTGAEGEAYWVTAEKQPGEI